MGNIVIYATKGFEYLLILGFLAAFTAFYLYFTSRRFEPGLSKAIAANWADMAEWFRVPANLLFHQGHAWATVDADDPSLVRVGIDDFTQKMIGRVDSVAAPPVGTMMRQGEKGWSLHADHKVIDMLAPLSGEIVAVNSALTGNAALVNNDPFGDGWLYKVKATELVRESKNLLAGSLAAKWMETVVASLRGRMESDLGMVYQDGGVPMSGMAKNIDAQNWDRLVAEFLLT